MNPIIQILLTLGVAILFGLLLMNLVTMSVHLKDYKYYKSTYAAIHGRRFFLVRDSDMMETYRRPADYDSYNEVGEILFFKDGIRNDEITSIKLLSSGGSNYIHDKGGMDLYARYWFKKIMKARLSNNQLLERIIQSQPQPTRSIPLEPDITITFNRPFKFLR